MQITQVSVTYGRTVPDPYQQYANYKPELTIQASLQLGDDVAKCVSDLQLRACTMVEQHIDQLVQPDG